VDLLSVDLVDALVFSHNRASIAILEALGFQQAGEMDAFSSTRERNERALHFHLDPSSMRNSNPVP
jgi:RimJ/RimL family protein N-acetyltransferase